MKELRTFILDLLYPRYCLGCSRLIDELTESHLCLPCESAIPFKNNFVCAFCSSQVIIGKTCPFCRKNYRLDRLLVASDYEYPLVEKMIKGLKYRFIDSLAKNIGQFMVGYLKRKVIPHFDLGSPLVTAVPLHRSRSNWRGYNQSELIAQNIAQHFNWPYEQVLTRKQNNLPQADIKDRQTRIKNMNGVFACKKSEAVDNKTIILIDDVSTTGSTLNDCARALKGAGLPGQGTKEVIGFVFARNR